MGDRLGFGFDLYWPPRIFIGWLVMDDATLRILMLAEEMAGSEQRAAIWFKHQPLPGWAGKTASDLVDEGKADQVLAYLEAVRSGVYA